MAVSYWLWKKKENRKEKKKKGTRWKWIEWRAGQWKWRSISTSSWNDSGTSVTWLRFSFFFVWFFFLFCFLIRSCALLVALLFWGPFIESIERVNEKREEKGKMAVDRRERRTISKKKKGRNKKQFGATRTWRSDQWKRSPWGFPLDWSSFSFLFCCSFFIVVVNETKMMNGDDNGIRNEMRNDWEKQNEAASQ